MRPHNGHALGYTGSISGIEFIGYFKGELRGSFKWGCGDIRQV